MKRIAFALVIIAACSNGSAPLEPDGPIVPACTPSVTASREPAGTWRVAIVGEIEVVRRDPVTGRDVHSFECSTFVCVGITSAATEQEARAMCLARVVCANCPPA